MRLEIAVVKAKLHIARHKMFVRATGPLRVHGISQVRRKVCGARGNLACIRGGLALLVLLERCTVLTTEGGWLSDGDDRHWRCVRTPPRCFGALPLTKRNMF
jgi:hypothetical protein